MTDIPIEKVRALHAQGLDNNQIIQSLQRDGFTSSQIFNALNQIHLAEASPAMPGGTPMQQPIQPNFPPPPHPPGAASPQSAAPHPSSYGGGNVEEMVEAVIDEKWNELVKDITSIIEWKNQAQNTIVSIEQQFKDLKAEFDKLHQALIAKIGEYDKNILDVGSEVKAMEKVFSRVLPVFTENVAELSKITKTMQAEKGNE